MKSASLIVNWHNENAPIYSAHFQHGDSGRFATAAGDTNVRLWRLEVNGEERNVEYLSTLARHTQAVNVVRFAPKGDMLASAGDDGNIILWIPSETHSTTPALGSEGLEDKETWRIKHMARSSGAEIYDLAWSPDGVYFIIGSMDNVARIYNAHTGQMIRHIAEHNHFVQGVAWDPMNEYVATQSSDRVVHVYSLRTKDGRYTLDSTSPADQATTNRIGVHAKMDLPARRISSHSPAPPDMSALRAQAAIDNAPLAIGSPAPSAPGTPQSFALPMNPPSVISHSRKSSFGSSPSMRRSASPAPSMPLPAVKPMEASPKPYTALGAKNSYLYANETLTSFFRRLTFTPDGSLLLTPAGQFTQSHQASDAKPSYEVLNTVYIYTRAGLSKDPLCHLPGLKKPSVVIRCSPIVYTIRKSAQATKHITIDTSSHDEAIPSLPEPVLSTESSPTVAVMDPPPLIHQPSNSTEAPTSTPRKLEVETGSTTAADKGPPMAFSLPYRMVYAVGTQDSVLLYDTQQQTPLCIVSNLHCATFTDLSWSPDGQTLLVTSTDGFCSTITFSPGELGQIYTGEFPSSKHPMVSTSAASTPAPTPTSGIAPPSPFPAAHQRTPSYPSAPSPQPIIHAPQPMRAGSTPYSARPCSPTRSNSASSVATQASYATPAPGTVISNPTLVTGTVPGITATNSSSLPLTTPPQTPHSAASSVVGSKRNAEGASESEGDKEQVGGEKKKRRIAPTLVSQPKE